MTSSIIGIPTTRVSDVFIRTRLLNQIQFDQTELFRIQLQLSTGHRFEVPSADPVAALQVMNLQQLLERKSQIGTNLQTNQSYLSITDSALSNVADLLTEIRAAAIGVVGTTSTATERETVTRQINQTLAQLLNTGNQQFRGRYLFSGTDVSRAPFRTTGSGLVEYLGNCQHLASYSDINLLFDTNVTGDEAFGTISSAVRGTASLTPTLTNDTRLADLREGQGISKGAILISDGSHPSVTIDLSGAETIGDVAALIKAHPPAGRELYVDVTATGLKIQLANPLPGDNLSIREAGSGTVANELGILCEKGSGTAPIESCRPLQPILRGTTALTQILGAYASTVVHSLGTDNDVRVTADVMGPSDGKALLNGVQVRWVADDHEEVVYTPGESLEVHVIPNVTLAKRVVDLINNAHDLGEIPFTAEIDPLDNVGGGNRIVEAGAWADTRDGAGESFDQVNGLRITNQGHEYNLSFPLAKTVQDVLNAINGLGVGIRAEINETRNGINLHSQTSGCDFMVGENGGKTASQLGIRSLTPEVRLSDLNFGRGVNTNSLVQYAQATVETSDPDTRILFRAKQAGAEWNDYTIRFVDTGVPAVHYDPLAHVIEVDFNSAAPDPTTAGDVMAMLEGSSVANDFEFTLEGADTTPVVTEDTMTAGGADGGVDFTITRADGTTLSITLAAAATINDVLDLINLHEENSDRLLVAQLNRFGNGIELVDYSTGAGNLTVTQNPMSHAAVELGLIASATDSSATGRTESSAKLISPGYQNDILITSRDPDMDLDGVEVIFDPAFSGVEYIPGVSLTVGIDPAVTTAADVVKMINNSSVGNIFSADFDPTDVDPLTHDPNRGQGLVSAVSATMEAVPQIAGRDVHPREVEGIFTALLRMRQALMDDDVSELQRAIQLLDEKTTDMNFARAELGARQNNLDVMKDCLESENIELQSILSQTYDVDMVEVATNLSSRQAIYQAALMSIAQISQMTLLDYL